MWLFPKNDQASKHIQAHPVNLQFFTSTFQQSEAMNFQKLSKSIWMLNDRLWMRWRFVAAASDKLGCYGDSI